MTHLHCLPVRIQVEVSYSSCTLMHGVVWHLQTPVEESKPVHVAAVGAGARIGVVAVRGSEIAYCAGAARSHGPSLAQRQHRRHGSTADWPLDHIGTAKSALAYKSGESLRAAVGWIGRDRTWRYLFVSNSWPTFCSRSLRPLAIMSRTPGNSISIVTACVEHGDDPGDGSTHRRDAKAQSVAVPAFAAGAATAGQQVDELRESGLDATARFSAAELVGDADGYRCRHTPKGEAKRSAVQARLPTRGSSQACLSRGLRFRCAWTATASTWPISLPTAKKSLRRDCRIR